MGKFLSTSYRDTVENITEFYEDLVNNPFYKFNDSKPSFVTYYNIDKLHSSVDPGSKLQYDNIGEETPMRFNRIYNFALYGIDKIELQSEIGEFGLEDNTIEGEAFILPNTIIPYEGDYFEISHVHDSTWLFIVKDVQKDTLDNGSNAYKISYKLEYDDNSKIQKNIQANYELIEKNEGTNVVVVARCEDVDIARKLDAQATKLKSYYQDLYYNERVQTFIYQNFMQYRVYDPFLIEFLIRNRVLDNGEEDYIYVCHQIPITKTFAIDYDKTFLRAIELRDHKKIRRYLYKTTLMPIKAYGTTFYGRYEGYFTSKYDDLDVPEGTNNCFDEDLMDHIVDHKLYEDIPNYDDDSYWKNIIVKYFYMDPLNEKEVEDIDNIKFEDPIYMFYMIPVLIYCLEKYIEYVLK